MFTKHRERIHTFREIGNLKHLCRNELGKACFVHDAAYFDNKDLAKRTISDKILKDKAYKIPRYCPYNGYQRALLTMVYKFFDKETGSGVLATRKAEVSVNELAEELHKLVIKKFKRRKVSARFKDIIWVADLSEMESLSSKNRNVKYLLCVVDVFTKHAWVKPLKDEKGKTVLNTFFEMVSESNCKPNKLWFVQGKEFYNKLMHGWLDKNYILMYSTHNEGKSEIAERFIKTLGSKIYGTNYG